MTETRHDSSTGLTTLGRCLIAAGLASSVCGVALDERDLLRIGVLVIVLPLLAALFTSRIRLVVRVERRLAATRMTARTTTEAVLSVHSRGRLPRTGLLLTDALPDVLGISPRFFAHPPRRSEPPVELSYPLTPLVRGVHMVGPLTMRVSDPLGLADYERELVGRVPLTVVPRVTPLSGLPDGFGRGEGESGSTGLRRGPGEHDALVRPYEPGDPLRKVHWKSTARRDELMVRLEERPWHGGVTVLLDHRCHAHRGRGAEASLEWAIELVASVCRHLITHGRRVTLVTENGVTLSNGRDVEALLDALALLRTSNQPGLICPPASGGELFAVLGAVDPGTVRPLIEGAEGGHGHAVLLDVAAWTAPDETRPTTGVAAASRAFNEAGWSVLTGRPERGPDRVWNDFCRRLPVRLGTGR